MQYSKKNILIIMVISIFLMTAVTTPSLANDLNTEVSGETMAVDFVLLRPLGLAVTAIGCVFYIASFPFTVWNEKNRKRAGYYFVVEPASYTFVRPLGEVGDFPDGY